MEQTFKSKMFTLLNYYFTIKMTTLDLLSFSVNIVVKKLFGFFKPLNQLASLKLKAPDKKWFFRLLST